MIDGAWKPLPDSSVLAAAESRFKALVNSWNSCFGASQNTCGDLQRVLSQMIL